MSKMHLSYLSVSAAIVLTGCADRLIVGTSPDGAVGPVVDASTGAGGAGGHSGLADGSGGSQTGGASTVVGGVGGGNTVVVGGVGGGNTVVVGAGGANTVVVGGAGGANPVVGSGGSGGTAGDPGYPHDAGQPVVRDGDIVDAPQSGCIEVATWPGMSASVTYTRKTWNASTRVLLRETSASPGFEEASIKRLADRYTDDGRNIAYAGFGSGAYDNFQQDWQYDAQGNTTDFRLAYPAKPDVMVPSTADVWMGMRYQNSYAGGRLVSVVSTPYGPGNASASPQTVSYHEDSAGRCDRIETVSEGGRTRVETRSYDAQGRLTQKRVTYDRIASVECLSGLTNIEYDAQGRILSSHGWCDSSGEEIGVTTYQYDVQGGVSIDYRDYWNDTPNDIITLPDGGTRSVTHSIVTRTPACAAIEAAIGAPSDLRCRN